VEEDDEKEEEDVRDAKELHPEALVLNPQVEEDDEEEEEDVRDAKELLRGLRTSDRFGAADRMLGTALMQALMGLYRLIDSKILLEQKRVACKAFPPGTIPACGA